MIFLLCAGGLALTGGMKLYQMRMEERQLEIIQEEKVSAEIMARNAEAQSRVLEMQKEIEQLLPEKEKLAAFIEQINNGQAPVQREEQVLQPGGDRQGDETLLPEEGMFSEEELAQMSESGNETVSGNESVSGNDQESISDNSTISGNLLWPFWSGISDNDISGNSISGNSISGNGISDNSISGNRLPDGELNYYDGTMTDSSIFDPWRAIYVQPEMTLEERRQYRTSLQETLEVNQSDREFIAENEKDFSQTKIACLGDSITAAANLDTMEDYQQYSYPTKMKELLHAQEVYNLGIGGSSIGRYWADAFVDRYRDIPEDTDIIIVMGGTNDGFCVSGEEFGNLRDRTPGTFCGDLDELMQGIMQDYPDAKVYFATPLPNILHDYLRSERDYLLPQKDFADVIRTLAMEYGFEVVDLYNSNILDSHDTDIVEEYMPDGVHCNPDGYQILAEHFAAELVRQ